MNLNLPLSEQFRVAGLEWAKLDNAAQLLEDGKSAFLAQKKSALGDMADNKAEKIVKSSAEWSIYIKTMVAARKAATIAKIELEYVRMRFQEWSSSEANKRAEMRL